jgi:GTP-binding protein HflX
MPPPDAEARAEEAARLVESAGAEVAQQIRGKRDRPDAATYAGSGKVDEIRGAVQEHRAEIVVFDCRLSAAQVRNLEKALSEGGEEVAVYDRTDLILNIFAQRAQSHEGKLQVELARLEHLSTRLVRGWTHLERQRGSLGKTGGPGEKQIELDRRLIGERVKKLKERLKKSAKVRRTQRSGRTRSGVLRVALVGYTNAGKSTLFNRLTRADTFVANQLFATLDTTTRRLWLAPGAQIAISDTVGFIRDLPHGLVDAFRADTRRDCAGRPPAPRHRRGEPAA